MVTRQYVDWPHINSNQPEIATICENAIEEMGACLDIDRPLVSNYTDYYMFGLITPPFDIITPPHNFNGGLH